MNYSHYYYDYWFSNLHEISLYSHHFKNSLYHENLIDTAKKKKAKGGCVSVNSHFKNSLRHENLTDAAKKRLKEVMLASIAMGLS